MGNTMGNMGNTLTAVCGKKINNINRLSGAGDRDRTDDIQLGKPTQTVEFIEVCSRQLSCSRLQKRSPNIATLMTSNVSAIVRD
ncbi:hypothetical protein MMMDOFMJ_3469 [Methylobacterium gnaphalii]|nr:hypothetical protein MMMDOFMJ_3469 [Methylobacterium gnaphalii]